MNRKYFVSTILLLVWVTAMYGQVNSSDGTFDWHVLINRQVITTILLGALSGYVASRITGGEGFGFLGNIVVGVIGGLIGKFMVDLWDIPLLHGFFGTLVSSVGGALILIFFIEIIKYLRKTNTKSTRARK